MATRRNKIQRTSDGNYLDNSGNWGSAGSARALTSRGDVGAVVNSKAEGVYRMVKEYVVG
tara:strand:+ start:341 stop:520 length:180 start_codon:yes stop_codon:yes gene_type:complete